MFDEGDTDWLSMITTAFLSLMENEPLVRGG
jgi:hypothetical protein